MSNQQLLLTTAARVLKLDDDIALLKALAEVARHWRDPVDVDGLTSLEKLLSTAQADLDSDAVTRAFAALGLADVHEALTRLIGQVTGGIKRIPEKYRTLLRKLSEFQAGDPKALVDWTLTGSLPDVIGDDRFALDVGATLALAFDAGAKWPTAGELDGKLLRLGVQGDVTLGGKAAIPYGGVTVGIEAGASAGVDLDYYFQAEDSFYALAVAGRLDNLPDPFDFQSVWSEFETGDGGLKAIRYRFDGSAHARVEVGFADARALGEGIQAGVGWTVKASASLKRDFTLELRQVRQDGAAAMAASLSRADIDERTFGSVLKVGVDVSGLTTPVIESLKRAVGKWNAALEAIEPYLSPGTHLRKAFGEALDDAVADLISSAPLRAAVQADLKNALGVAPGNDAEIIAWLSGKIAGAIDGASAHLDGEVDKAAGRAVALLGEALPSLTGEHVDELTKLVRDQIQTLEDALRKAAATLLDAVQGDLLAAFKKAGAPLNNALDDLDEALAAVRNLLKRYDDKVQAILKKAEEAAKKKVTLQLSREVKRKDALAIKFKGVFTSGGPEAREVFRSLTRGRLAALVAMVETQTDPSGFRIDRAASSIKESSNQIDVSGVEVVFLNLGVTASQVVTTDVGVEVDGLGNVQVNTRTELKKILDSPWGQREASFVNASALVLAAGALFDRKTTLQLGVGARFSDDTLKLGDVADFIERLETARLVPETTIDDARRVFARWAGAGGKISGEIAASASLSQDQIKTLLRLGQRTSGDVDAANLKPEARKEIIRIGARAMVDARAFTSDFSSGLQRAHGMFLDKTVPATVEDIAMNYRKKGVGIPVAAQPLPPVGRPPDRDMFAHYNLFYFLYCVHVLEELADMVEVMGDIYLATPSQSAAAAAAGGGWSKDRYMSAQLQMAETSKLWLRIADNVMQISKADISRRTVAFMRAMADLAGVPRPGGVVISMTHRPEGGKAETVTF